MDKDYATYKLGGGNADLAAKWLHVSSAIYAEWPPVLSPVMVDRVIGALMRKEMAKALDLSPRQFFADARNEALLETIFERVAIASVMSGLMPSVPSDFASAPGYAASKPPRFKRPAPQEPAAAPA